MNFYNDLQPVSEAQTWAVKIKSAAFNVLISSVKRTAHEQPSFRSRRSYIQCTKDSAIDFELQKGLVAAAGIQCVGTLDTDHSPFLTIPEKTAEMLMDQLDHFV